MRLTAQEMVKTLKLTHRVLFKIITTNMGLVLVSARFIPKLLTSLKKATRKNACTEDYYFRNLDPDFFHDQIVTEDETHVHYYEPTIAKTESLR